VGVVESFVIEFSEALCGDCSRIHIASSLLYARMHTGRHGAQTLVYMYAYVLLSLDDVNLVMKETKSQNIFLYCCDCSVFWLMLREALSIPVYVLS
jgi:hypothetical protein